MKIKGVIEYLKIKKLKKIKNDSKNSKNMSRTFSGVVVGSVGSVHFKNSSLIWLIFLKIYRPLREVNGNPLQHSCLENSMDGGAW